MIVHIPILVGYAFISLWCRIEFMQKRYFSSVSNRLKFSRTGVTTTISSIYLFIWEQKICQ